ncbi:MAG: hypothetical protein IKF90_15015, partial [Parasporobacterium sp.]|nr:hypothetical protein [Parasporobacterium sp.]
MAVFLDFKGKTVIFSFIFLCIFLQFFIIFVSQISPILHVSHRFLTDSRLFLSNKKRAALCRSSDNQHPTITI